MKKELFTFIFRRYLEKQQPACPEDKTSEKVVCMECCAEFSIYEVLNNNYWCPKCGKLIEVTEERRPTVFT
jgi:hypothetical protein